MIWCDKSVTSGPTDPRTDGNLIQSKAVTVSYKGNEVHNGKTSEPRMNEMSDRRKDSQKVTHVWTGEETAPNAGLLLLKKCGRMI